MLVKTSDDHRDSDLYTIKYILLGYKAEDIRRFWNAVRLGQQPILVL